MRLIHRFDFKGKDVVKGINFEGLRPIGKIEKLLSAWSSFQIEEIHFQGAATSLHNTFLDNEIVKTTKEILSRPITVGGGIKSLETAKRLINQGADRIAINSAFFNDKNLLEIIIKELGESTLVVSIDVSKCNGSYYCFINNGRDNTNMSLKNYIKTLKESGNPEILVTNIDRDGLCKGVDTELINELKPHKGPIVLSGGISSIDDIQIFKNCLHNQSNGVSVGRAFHNFILSQDIEIGENLAFASKFELKSGKRKEEKKMLSPFRINLDLEEKS